MVIKYGIHESPNPAPSPAIECAMILLSLKYVLIGMFADRETRQKPVPKI